MIITPAEIIEGPEEGEYRMLAVVPNSHAHPVGYCAELHSHKTKLEACRCYVQYCIDTKLVIEEGPEGWCCLTGQKTNQWANIGIFIKAVSQAVIDEGRWDKVFRIELPFMVTQESEIKGIKS